MDYVSQIVFISHISKHNFSPAYFKLLHLTVFVSTRKVGFFSNKFRNTIQCAKQTSQTNTATGLKCTGKAIPDLGNLFDRLIGQNEGNLVE